jgi:uncharacterized protein YbjQ (UPF0145 family)
MKLPLLAACFLAGFCSLPFTPVALAQGSVEATPVKVYAAGEITLDHYTVVKHLWTEDIRSAFYVPTYSNPAEGISALVAAAHAAGANGMVNVSCQNVKRGRSETSEFLCYGIAIKKK